MREQPVCSENQPEGRIQEEKYIMIKPCFIHAVEY